MDIKLVLTEYENIDIPDCVHLDEINGIYDNLNIFHNVLLETSIADCQDEVHCHLFKHLLHNYKI